MTSSLTNKQPLSREIVTHYKLDRRDFRKLKIQNGDVVLVKHGTPLSHQIQNGALTNAMAHAGLNRCIVAVVGEFDDVAVLDRATMRQHGWYRLEDKNEFGTTIENEDEEGDEEV